ncbi:hypothetical protein DH2020_005280 [Rehmannia glutinosa]|uniref:Agenet domain-containing protein n=1 Tax=Rehmannia glutinosa TaxID=99300 RepID=A0ABR0XG81_REHGL
MEGGSVSTLTSSAGCWMFIFDLEAFCLLFCLFVVSHDAMVSLALERCTPMDYNDNEYEGQNLHLSGEESSKISSVLRPFALPKFDFDDSLHGHLRFDSLVENEVFLGIPSQEDNQWIEDFSRGGSGIEFSSSAAESCALPRHINVWSEATSSESVEMLLKAVGQEEMVPGENVMEEAEAGENVMEESEPGDQLGSSTRQLENYLGQDNKIDSVDYGNSSQSPAEVEGNISGSNQSAEVEVVHTEYIVQAQETSFSSYGVCVDKNNGSLNVNSENSNIDLPRTSDNQGETCGLVNESLSTQVQENSPVLGTEIDKTESSSHNVVVSVRESVGQDKLSDISFISSSCITKAISVSVEEQEGGCNKDDGRLTGNAVETDHTRHGSHEIPPKMELSKEEHSVEICVANLGEASSMPRKGESASIDDKCDEVAFVVQPVGGQHGMGVFSSGTKIKELSEGRILHEKSSVSLQREAIEGHGIEESDAVTSTIYGNTELKQVPVIQPSDQHRSPVGSKDICPGSHSSLEAPHSTFESSALHDVLGNPSDKDGENNHADGLGNSAGATFDGGCFGEKSMIDDKRETGDTAVIQKENVEDRDHVPPPLVVGSVQTCTEDIISMEVDAHKNDLDVPVYEKDDKKSPLDLSDVVCDGDHVPPPLVAGSVRTCTEDIISMQMDAHESDLDVPVSDRDDKKLPPDSSDVVDDGNEKEVSTFPGEGVDVETTTGSQPNSSAGDYPALNTEVEGTKLISSCAEGGELVDSHEDNSPSCDTAYRDQSKETESEAPKRSITSGELFESTELAPVLDIQKGTVLDSEAGETKTSGQSVSLVESSSVAMPDKELSEKMENSTNDLIVQDGAAEAAPTEKPMEAEAGRNWGADSSTVSGAALVAIIEDIVPLFTSCTVENDKSNQAAAPDASCTDLPKSEINKQASLKRNDVENIAKVLTTSKISGLSVSSKEDGTFTFDTRPLGGQSAGDSSKCLQSFPRIQACKLSLTAEGSPSTSGSSQTDPMVVMGISHVSSLTPPSGGLRGPSERKPRRGSSKSGKASANKGNQVKETTPLRQSEKWEKSSPLLSPLSAGQLVKFESVAKSRGPVSIPTSSLPDLNTSAQSSAFFQQPFTDLQQVQLRAQIFVYGSLIQGAVPDEACMVSAFDGGRSVWEPSWRSCVERLHGQKSLGNNIETPVHARSGAKAPDQTNRQGFPQSEAFASMTGRASNKAIPSPLVNPTISLSSPLWNISTPSAEALPPSSTARSAVIDYQAVSPLNPYQTPPIRNYVTHTTWASQAPFPLPWLASSQTSQYPAFPITAEPVKLTPVKESSLAITSGTKHLSPIPATHTGASTMFAGASSLDLKKVKVSTGQTADTKTRKRKKSSGAEDAVQISVTASLADTVSGSVVASQLSNKGPAVEDISQIPLIVRNQADSLPKPVVSCHYSTSVAVATPSSFVPKDTINQFFSVVSPSITSDQLKRGDSSIDKRALSTEGFSKVEEARLQAQEAAAHAAAAIRQCESVWSQLGQQKDSGLNSDAQSKLASAAVAIAAAASVAKAAAAAAKIASSAALQAKQMADEAITKSGTVNPTEYDTILVSNSMNLVNASPVSILKGGDRNNAPSIAISAAREASRKRIEAASAATRHAENLDAIVKAAELAAEAVSHAGKIVAMGEPFSLSELVETGPNNYWKVSQVATVPGLKPNDMNKNKSMATNAGEMPDVYTNQHEGPDKEMRPTSDVVSPVQELSRNVVDDHVAVEENLIASTKHGENRFKPRKDKKLSDSAKNVFAFSDPDIESRSTSYAETSIKEGSYVEVLKDRGDFKKAWFSASVLSLKDGEVLVSYTELQSDEGSEQLKEWISLDAKDGDCPKVRIPHPMTAVQFEGTRKRRRAAVKDYTWSIGDKVDAWVQDCWCEGIIAEKNKKDATTLSVHFPAQEETLMVKVWHLRPTLIWRDGQWIEWCRPVQDSTSQGDTPVEKRPKLGGTTIEAKAKAKVSKNIDFVETGRNEEPRLPLSANEKVFNIGNTRAENKPNMVRTMRSGVEKEGSRVVFGVPKPGKKRKFMEVSKHYVSDRIPKTNVPNDSVKLAKFLAPQGSGSRVFKNNSKPDLKGKQVAESRPRALKSGKPPSIPSRTLARKDDSTSSQPNARNAAVSDTAKGSISNDENESSEQNLTESGSFSNVEETSGGTMVFSAQARPQENRKRTATRNIRSGRLNQGKLAPASGKSAKNEANENSIAETSEPRRSNRRIQPTSRVILSFSLFLF